MGKQSEEAREAKQFARLEARLAEQERRRQIKRSKPVTDKQQEKMRAWSEAMPIEEKRRSLWEGELRRRYGMSIEDWWNILGAQNGGCGVCGRPNGDSWKRRLHVDHDHATGRVRGLLCTRCNWLLGLVDHHSIAGFVELVESVKIYLGQVLPEIQGPVKRRRQGRPSTKPLCTVGSCHLVARLHGMCNSHYRAHYRETHQKPASDFSIWL